jgi:hypothetical protein
MYYNNLFQTTYLSLKKNPLKVIVFFPAITLLFIIFFIHKHYPMHDEIITFDRYLRWHTFLRRDAPNNHLLLSFIGTISNSIFSFNFYLLRFFSFLSLIGIFLIYTKSFKNYYIFLLFFITIVSSELIINYSYVFRGYYLSSFISVIIFYFLHKYYFKKNKIKYISIIFFLLFLLSIHALYTLYIVVPIIFSLFIFLIKEKKLKIFLVKFILLFIIPTTVVYILVIITTGFSNEFSGNLNINFFLANLTSVISKSFGSGIISVFFDTHLQTTSFLAPITSRLTTIKALLNLFYGHTIIFLVLFFSFFFAIYNFIFKKSNIFDLIILIFFIFFIFLNKIPFDRVYISFIYFFIFYITYNLENIIKNFFLNFMFKNNFFSFLVCIFTLLIFLLNININTTYSQELKNEIENIKNFKNNCDAANENLNQDHIWILINFYPDWCYYKYDYIKKINILSSSRLDTEYKKKEISTFNIYKK